MGDDGVERQAQGPGTHRSASARSVSGQRASRSLARLREEMSMSQAEVAAAACPPVASSLVALIECGLRAPSLSCLDRIAPALGVDPWRLIMPDPGLGACEDCLDRPEPGTMCLRCRKWKPAGR
jgi:transcriptional regulator with XRE-family HTH domain